MEKNITSSPGIKNVGAEDPGVNNFNGVRPMIDHPPGERKGYIPVCFPVIATLPGSTNSG